MDLYRSSPHEPFGFTSWEQMARRCEELGVTLPYDPEISALLQTVRVGERELPNALCVHPMEGCDADERGDPQELTFRRYRRWGAGGAGLIWVEATAVTGEGRGNPHQLWLTPETLPGFKRLVEETLQAATHDLGQDHHPLLVLQLTHSGRYSKPEGSPTPIIAHHSGPLDPLQGLGPDYPLISDGELERLQESYVQAARLAWEAGFEAVDIKSSHGYLVSELLASHTRKDSRYGGDFEGRIRLLEEIVGRIGAEVPGLMLTVRLNIYDALPYPWGFGMATDGSMRAELREPVELMRRLRAAGVKLVSVGCGNPQYNAQVERPYDRAVRGGQLPPEHPLVNIALVCELTRQAQQQVPDLPLVATGLSWLRQFFPGVAAGMLREGAAQIAGLGRGALACPDFARELQERGELDPRRLCVTCSGCTQIMRDGGQVGCVVRDVEVYGPIYRQGRGR